jgi:ABC-2 type transport system ATP-binding protein
MFFNFACSVSLMRESRMNPIEARGIAKSFGATTALRDLSLSVEEGELFGIVGPDGAGKTTTMRVLSSILDPDSGDAWVAGFHTTKEAEAVKEHIGYMSQRFGLYPDLTVLENIDFYADIYGVPRGRKGKHDSGGGSGGVENRSERIERLLAFANLAPFRHRRAGALSGGMKQKLGLACALVHTPKVLLLDEPTSGVDPVSRREFWNILNGLLHQRVTIFVSTAYLDEAERCHRIALIHKGELLALGSPSEVKRLMRGAILEIRSPDPRRVSRSLRAHFSPESVNLFGDRVHLVTETPQSSEARAHEILRTERIEVASIQAVEPGLEDVFVSVLGKKESGEG